MFKLDSQHSQLISPRIRSILSILIILHLGLFVASLSTASIEWTVRDRLIEIAMPYTAGVHMRLEGRPIADVTHTSADWQHRFQYRLSEQREWNDGVLTIGRGIGSKKRLSKYLTLIGEAADIEDTATAARLAQPLIDQIIENVVTGSCRRFEVRVVAESFADGVRKVDSIEENVRWQAAVVEVKDPVGSEVSDWAIVFLEEPRMNAKAADDNREVGSNAADGSEI